MAEEDHNESDGLEPLDNQSPSLSSEDVQEKYMSDDDLETLIKESLKHSLKIKNIIPKRRDEIEKIIKSNLSEFMNSYLILGYDVNNRQIEPIMYAKDDMSEDALGMYIQSYFVAMMRGEDKRR